MRVFTKISLPVSLVIIAAVVLVAFFSNWHLKRSLSNEVYLERKDDVIRTSKVLLNRSMFEHPETEESKEKFDKYIENLRSGDVVRLTIWDTNGMILASDLTSIIGEKATHHPELFSVYNARKPLFLEKKFDNNEPLQSSISPVRIVLIPLFLDNDFLGVVEVHMASNAIIEETIAKSVYSLAGLLIMTGFVLVFAMIFVVRRVIIDPIRVITVASEKIGTGNFDVPVSVQAKDEIGSLARVFIRMRDHLKANISELRKKREAAEHAEKLERIANKKIATEKEELQKFKQAVDNSFDHVIITDPDGSILYANTAAERMTGFSFQEMNGETPALWGKQMPASFYEEFWKIIKIEKKPYSGEVKNKRKDGTMYTAIVRVSPILDDENNVRFFVGVEQDVTEKRKQEEMEREYLLELEAVNRKVTEEKIRAEGIFRYLQSIGEGIYATDRNGTIIFCNTTAAEMIGRTPEDVLGADSRTLFRFCIGTDDKTCDFLPFYEAIKIKKSLSFNSKTFLIGKQHPIPVAGTLSPIIEVRHIAGAIVVFQDITERYELEQMKDRFLSIAAHQLRTPLGSMRWSMELLESGDFGKLPKQALAAVEELRRNSNRMMILVRDLLSVFRIDQAAIRESPENTDLESILSEAVRVLEGDAKKKHIQIKLDIPKKPLPKISIVKKHISEAVENLVANAIRYGKEKGVVIGKVEKEKGYIVLSVSDDGIGIPKEDQSKIFAKFFRASNAIRSFTDGSGLGLFVVKSYVEESNGEISFKSEENVGTTFTMRFPLKEE